MTIEVLSHLSGFRSFIP